MIVVQIDDAINRTGIIPKGRKDENQNQLQIYVKKKDGNLSGACGEYVSVEWISSHCEVESTGTTGGSSGGTSEQIRLP